MDPFWYVRRDGRVYGPFSEDDFRQLLAGRRARPTDLVARAGEDGWRTLASLWPDCPPPDPDADGANPFAGLESPAEFRARMAQQVEQAHAGVWEPDVGGGRSEPSGSRDGMESAFGLLLANMGNGSGSNSAPDNRE